MQDRAPAPPLYPPKVTPSARALPLAPFLIRFIRNPLRALPRAVYEHGVVSYGKKQPCSSGSPSPN